MTAKSDESSMTFQKNDRRIINGWAFFDWANSAFALVITAAIFPAYYVAVTDDYVDLFGMQVSNSSLYAYAISGSYLLITLFTPILSGIADYGGKRKFFLKLFTVIGSISCLSLFFFEGMGQLVLGTASFMLAMVGFAGALVFYNAFLPVIATEDRYDMISARGFAFGYFGSVLLLLFNLAMIMSPETFGIADAGMATRIAFVTVGLWWMGFALIPFTRLPSDEKTGIKRNMIRKGIQELLGVWRAVKVEKNIKAFLLSFFFYSAGVQTVLFLAATFAEKELSFATDELIMVILLLQLVAIAGAFLFARLSKWKGNKTALFTMLTIWIAICLFAYFVTSQGQFYVIAAAVGLVMGGIQSLSRSTYSKLLPENTDDPTSYFSFYDVLEKVAILLGTFGFGFIEQVTGSIRSSVLLMAAFFIMGILLLTPVRIERSEAVPANS